MLFRQVMLLAFISAAQAPNCPVCFDDFPVGDLNVCLGGGGVPGCGNYYACGRCYLRLLEKAVPECPLCRANINVPHGLFQQIRRFIIRMSAAFERISAAFDGIVALVIAVIVISWFPVPHVGLDEDLAE